MKLYSVFISMALLACGDADRLPGPKHAVTTSSSSASTGGSGGQGGAGGDGGSGGSGRCDPWRDTNCCAQDPGCGPGSAGECLTKEELCSSDDGKPPKCVGKPNPAKNVHCGIQGVCVEGECIEPSTGGTGGV